MDSGLGGVIRASAADLELLGELVPPWESTTFWRALSSRANIIQTDKARIYTGIYTLTYFG